MRAKGHVVSEDGVRLGQHKRVGTWEGLGEGVSAVEYLNVIVGQREVLEVGGELPRQRDRADLVVGEVQPYQLGAQAREVIGNFMDQIIRQV